MDNQTTSPKFQAFVDELNVLLQKYQFALRPVLSYNVDGITPHLEVDDNFPPTNEIINNSTDPVPAQLENPAPAEPQPAASPEVPTPTPPETPVAPEVSTQ